RKLRHELVEALSLLGSEEVADGNPDVGEVQLAGVLTMHADLVEDAAALEPRCGLTRLGVARLDDDERDPLSPLAAGAAHDDDETGVRGVGDEGLRPGDDVVLAVAAGGRADPLQV